MTYMLADEIKKHLKDDIDITVFETLDSTNSEMKRRTADIKNYSVIIAKHQSGGRGRHGKSFFSPENSGLYMSMYFAADSIENVLEITSKAAVAVSRAIERVALKKVGIKWVNDLYIDGKKVCGILAEGVWKDENPVGVILGVGINCYKTDFPEELRNIAGSVADNINEVSFAHLTAEVISELIKCDKLPFSKMADEYRKKSFLLGKRIYVVGEACEYTALDIDENGGLVVLDDLGEKRVITSGEVSVRLK